MDHHHTWFDLKAGTKDTEFARSMARYMEHLRQHGAIEGWRSRIRPSRSLAIFRTPSAARVTKNFNWPDLVAL